MKIVTTYDENEIDADLWSTKSIVFKKKTKEIENLIDAEMIISAARNDAILKNKKCIYLYSYTYS